jgi:hypothetical protein
MLMYEARPATSAAVSSKQRPRSLSPTLVKSSLNASLHDREGKSDSQLRMRRSVDKDRYDDVEASALDRSHVNQAKAVDRIARLSSLD